MEADEAISATPQGSIISSVVVAEKKRSEKPLETSRSKYEEKVKELVLEDLECRQELARALGLEQVSHEDLGRHQCVDWLKAHETHFSRAKLMETGSDWNSHKIGDGTDQLQTSQVIREPGIGGGASQAPNQHFQN